MYVFTWNIKFNCEIVESAAFVMLDCEWFIVSSYNRMYVKWRIDRKYSKVIVLKFFETWSHNMTR